VTEADVDACEFTLLAGPRAPSAARARIATWLTMTGWPTDEASDIVYAISEAVSNAAEHAYPLGAHGTITVTACVEAFHDDASA